MARKHSRKRTHPKPKAVLRLPDLDQAKSAVLNSLTSADAQRGYRNAIDEFVGWYCSGPRLSFSRTVVLRYPIHQAPNGERLKEKRDQALLAILLACGVRRDKRETCRLPTIPTSPRATLRVLWAWVSASPHLLCHSRGRPLAQAERSVAYWRRCPESSANGRAPGTKNGS
jgi:hypothetical protein